MKNYNTVLFDLDGTLLNTNELIISSFLYTLDKYYPGQYSREDVIPFNGPSLQETFTKIDENRAEEMIQTYVKHNHEHHDKLVTMFDGVYETLEKLSNEGLNLAIVSTKRRSTVDMGLKLTNLEKFFPVVITGDDVQNFKPHPEPLQIAMEKLGVDTAETLMVGDNHHDIAGGTNAGVDTVAVEWSLKGVDFLKKYAPSYTIKQMDELLSIVGVK